MQEHQIFGYIRVSTKEQNTDRQQDALAPPGIPKKNLYVDKQSGKDFDRLGRDYQEIIEQWRIITKERQADIRVMDMPLLDTTYGKDLLGTFIADLAVHCGMDISVLIANYGKQGSPWIASENGRLSPAADIPRMRTQYPLPRICTRRRTFPQQSGWTRARCRRLALWNQIRLLVSGGRRHTGYP